MNDLIIETVESYNVYIQRIPNGCQAIADQLRKDEISDALGNIRLFSEGVAWLIEVNTVLKKHKIENDLQSEKVTEFLIEINEGLERQDFVLVADMFEYEIKPFFEEVKPYDISVN